MGTDDWRLRRDDVVSFRLKFKKRRFQMIDDTKVQNKKGPPPSAAKSADSDLKELKDNGSADQKKD